MAFVLALALLTSALQRKSKHEQVALGNRYWFERGLKSYGQKSLSLKLNKWLFTGPQFIDPKRNNWPGSHRHVLDQFR